MTGKKDSKNVKKADNELSDSETKLLDVFLSEEAPSSGARSQDGGETGVLDGGGGVPGLEKGMNKYLAVGKLLEDARKMKKISLQEVADEMKTKPQILQMIEEGKYDEVSEITYYYGCVGSFARYLSIDHDIIFDYLLKDDEAYATLVDSNKKSLIKDDDRAGGRRILRGHAGLGSFKYMIGMLAVFVVGICLFSFLNFKRGKEMKQKISIEQLMS